MASGGAPQGGVGPGPCRITDILVARGSPMVAVAFAIKTESGRGGYGRRRGNDRFVFSMAFVGIKRRMDWCRLLVGALIKKKSHPTDAIVAKAVHANSPAFQARKAIHAAAAIVPAPSMRGAKYRKTVEIWGITHLGTVGVSRAR
jgi:hypothetical protein